MQQQILCENINGILYFICCVVKYCLLQILFLNKIDLFEEKIINSERHLRRYFPKYIGEMLTCNGIYANLSYRT